MRARIGLRSATGASVRPVAFASHREFRARTNGLLPVLRGREPHDHTGSRVSNKARRSPRGGVPSKAVAEEPLKIIKHFIKISSPLFLVLGCELAGIDRN